MEWKNIPYLKYFIIIVFISIFSNILFFLKVDSLFIAWIDGIIMSFYIFIEMIIGVIHKKKTNVIIFLLISCIAIIGIISSFGSGYMAFYRYDLGNIVESGEIVPINFRTSFYFSAVTFFSLGYGDLAPTMWAREMAISEVFIAQLFIIGIFGSAISVLLENIKDRKNNPRGGQK